MKAAHRSLYVMEGFTMRAEPVGRSLSGLVFWQFGEAKLVEPFKIPLRSMPFEAAALDLQGCD
jgi:hypothetical protein